MPPAQFFQNLQAENEGSQRQLGRQPEGLPRGSLPHPSRKIHRYWRAVPNTTISVGHEEMDLRGSHNLSLSEDLSEYNEVFAAQEGHLGGADSGSGFKPTVHHKTLASLKVLRASIRNLKSDDIDSLEGLQSDLLELVDLGFQQILREGVDSYVVSLFSSFVDPRVASCIARLIRGTLNKFSDDDMLSESSLMRRSVLELFDAHWKNGGNWYLYKSPSSSLIPNISAIFYGFTVASMIGVLFTARVIDYQDILGCLDILVTGDAHVHRLRAIHAILTHCNLHFYKNINTVWAELFIARLSAMSYDRNGKQWAWIMGADARLLEDIKERFKHLSGIRV